VKYFPFKDLLIAKNAKIKKLGILLLFMALAIPLLTALLHGHFDPFLKGFSEIHASLALAGLMGVVGGVFFLKPNAPDRLRRAMGKIFGADVDGNLDLRELSFVSEVFESLMKRGKIS
jgi:hypothetical protein